jgi:hypothetical protein
MWLGVEEATICRHHRTCTRHTTTIRRHDSTRTVVPSTTTRTLARHPSTHRPRRARTACTTARHHRLVRVAAAVVRALPPPRTTETATRTRWCPRRHRPATTMTRGTCVATREGAIRVVTCVAGIREAILVVATRASPPRPPRPSARRSDTVARSENESRLGKERKKKKQTEMYKVVK